jgi:hypothetical protein
MAAEIISIDKILRLLEKYDFLKIRLLRGSDAVYLDQVRPGESAAELQNRFADWINEFITDDNFKEYKLELYGNAESDTNGKKTLFLKTTIQFNPTPGALIKSGAPSMGAMPKDEGFTPREYIELAREKAILEARCAQLEDRILELEDELEDLRENQPNEENKPQGIGEVMNSALMANADKIIGVLCDKLLGGGQSMAIAGVETAETDVKYMLFENMCAIEPNFPDHLEMLYNLRKNSPVIYSIALEKLKSM